MELETVFVGRDNVIARELLQDGEPPVPGINRVVAHIGDVTLDTDTDPEISYSDNVVTIRLGGKTLRYGLNICRLTVYDVAHPNGLAWDEFPVLLLDWPADPE